MAGALDHDLNVLCPTHASQGFLSSISSLISTGVGCVVDAAGTERVTERDRDVITAQDVQNVVVILENGFSLPVICIHANSSEPPRETMFILRPHA